MDTGFLISLRPVAGASLYSPAVYVNNRRHHTAHAYFSAALRNGGYACCTYTDQTRSPADTPAPAALAPAPAQQRL